MRVLVVDPGTHEVLVDRVTGWARALGTPTVVPAEEAAAAAEGPGPVVLVWADTPRLAGAHAEGVRADLDGGAALVVGPTLDGAVYLLAMDEPRPELVGLSFARVLERAAELLLETGMLRHERRLVQDQDARALLADPMLDLSVRRALEA